MSAERCPCHGWLKVEPDERLNTWLLELRRQLRRPITASDVDRALREIALRQSNLRALVLQELMYGDGEEAR